MYYKNFVDFLVKYEEVSEKQLNKSPGVTGHPMDATSNTTLLYGSWGDELKQNLTKTVSSIPIKIF